MTNEKMHAPADTCNPIVERHADGAALVRVDGAELAFTGTSDTPRVRDLDLAGWFGYERPRDIRKLIKRMEAEGKLRGVEWRATVARYSAGRSGKGIREVTVTEAWLTREQSLLVATQAEGDRAWALTTVMAQVFEAVLDRRPPPAPPADPTMALAVAQALALVPGLVERVQSLSAEVSTLRAEVSTGVVGEAVAQTEIIRPLGQIAALAATPTKGPRSVRRRYENRLRALLGHAGPGSRWSMLPRRHLDVAQRQVAMWLDEAIDQRAARNRGHQGQLFFGAN